MARPLRTPANDTPDRIVDVAVRHLARSGPRGVELRSICLELGIAPSLMNYYFSSPAELIWRAALRGYEQHVNAQTEAFERAQSAGAAVENWVLATIQWTKENPGVAAVIDFPMLAAGPNDAGAPEDFVDALSTLSRTNVTTLGSGLYALMTNNPPRRVSSARIAAMIKLNSEFAYWISIIGFGTTGAAMWVAGRKPYGPLWKAFGFSPDKQIKATIRELLVRAGASDASALLDVPDDDAE
ncbi:MAG: TetR/AcrR family transcriptional regulator [Gaiellales bacterium]